MKRRLLGIVTVTVLLIQLFSICAVAAAPEVVQPYYTGVSAVATDLSIENSTLGLSKNRVAVILRSGYSAEVHMSLKQIGVNGVDEVKSWDDSLDATGEITHYYYIPSGYGYTLNVTIDVYDSNGDFVETIATNDSLTY